jgi:3-dehydroquinate dehydratase/shikimate dehydrogenase
MKTSNSQRKICIAIRDPQVENIAPLIAQARGQCCFLEMRLDYLPVDSIQIDHLRMWKELAGMPIIATFRRKANGGEFEGSADKQLDVVRLILEAGMDYLDLEIETVDDHLGGSLSSLPASSTKLIVSYHDFGETPAGLAAVYNRLTRVQPDVVKIATMARGYFDNLRLMQLVSRAQSDQIAIIVVAMGELGGMTRILAPSRGSLLTYASMERGKESAPGQFTARDLNEIYRIDEIHADTRLYGVIGYPLGQSLSPLIHNAAFQYLGLNCRYLPLPVKDLKDFSLCLGWFSGLSVTIPHKLDIAQYAQMVDSSVREAGAANTLALDGGQWRAYNTDVDGIELALAEPFREGITSAVILGAGGAARAAASVLKRRVDQVVVLARDLEKARIFAESYGFEADLLCRAGHYPADLLVNTTPIGMAPRTDESPLPDDLLNYRYVFDMVYNPMDTRLLRAARARGCRGIAGLDMFVGQAARQFELWTGQTAPVDLMHGVVRRHLESNRL